MKKIHIVSLGCPKNLIDSEVMAGILAEAGYSLTDSPTEASAILVNTCAFIRSAKEESIEEILRMAAWKQEKGGVAGLVVTGCLAQRYGKELEKTLPEVDLFLGLDEIPRIGAHLDLLFHGQSLRRRSVIDRPTFLMQSRHRRLLSPPTHSAYLKIADGCSNHCSYCAIPAIRGEARSRSIRDIVAEAELLASRGVRELILTAQDTTAYGADRKDKPALSRLLRGLAAIRDIDWIRILYAHPAHLTEELLRTMAQEEKICHYLDLPIQHSHDAILGAMQRQGDGALIRGVVQKARDIVPDIALRTSLITGFPGETLPRFEHLLSFIREIRFDHLGVFTYSPEEETKAAALPARISEKEKQRRRDLLMEIQAAISAEINETLIGTLHDVLVDGASDIPDYAYVGRCRRQAPEIDGVTHVRGRGLEAGRLIRCRIVAADEYDLFAEVL